MASKKRKILCRNCTENNINNNVSNNNSNVNGNGSGSGNFLRFFGGSKVNVQVQDVESQTTWTGKPRSRRRLETRCRSSSLHKQTAKSSTNLNVSTGRSKRMKDGPSLGLNESDECCCSSKRGKMSVSRSGILKRHGSLDRVTNYINRGMDQVASFIVESAIRFGKEHGVVIPEKGSRGVYQIATPGMFEEKKRTKKIRFKIPEGTLGYEDAKKAMWQRDGSEESHRERDEIDRAIRLKAVESRHPALLRRDSLGSPSESIRKIMPILEKLRGDDNVVESELDLSKVSQYIKEEKMRKGKRKSKSGSRKRQMPCDCNACSEESVASSTAPRNRLEDVDLKDSLEDILD